MSNQSLIFKTILVTFALGLLTLDSNSQTPVTVTIGNISGTSSWFYGPIFRIGGATSTMNYSRHAYVYSNTELGMPIGAEITKLEWLKKDGSYTTGANNFSCWLENSNDSTFPVMAVWASLVSGASQVYNSNNFNVPSGTDIYMGEVFNVPTNDTFIYTGNHLKILCDWERLGSVVGTIGINYYVNATPGKAIGMASAIPLTTTTTLVTATYGDYRPTLRITYSLPGIPTLIQNVQQEKEIQTILFPNPVNTELNVEINTLKATTVYVKIMDATARVVRMIEMPLQAGNNVNKIDLQSLVDGVYMVSITNNKGLNYTQTIRKK